MQSRTPEVRSLSIDAVYITLLSLFVWKFPDVASVLLPKVAVIVLTVLCLILAAVYAIYRRQRFARRSDACRVHSVKTQSD